MVIGVFPVWDDRVVAVIASDDVAGCLIMVAGFVT